jgi:hypothetical protein
VFLLALQRNETHPKPLRGLSTLARSASTTQRRNRLASIERARATERRHRFGLEPRTVPTASTAARSLLDSVHVSTNFG